MRYSQIVDGLPTPPQPLPTAFADVSNFHTLPDEILLEYGWYPYIPTSPPTYNIMTERRVQNYSLSGSVVVTGWQVIPFTAEEQAERVAQIIQTLGKAVKAHLDATVQAKDYDSIISACTYATSSVARHRDDGLACVNWRDAVWLEVYMIMDQVEAGTRPVPTIEALIAELPELVWP
jgi:hypothetical protein